MKGRYREFPFTPCPHSCIASPIINISYQTGMFVTTDEPASNYHNYQKSIVYIRILSWCFQVFTHID